MTEQPEQGKHIVFLHVPGKPTKTRVWAVVSKYNQSMILGQVRWFGRWRKYSFFPEKDSIYEEVCLRDIAGFCEKQSGLHWQNLKSLRAGPAPAEKTAFAGDVVMEQDQPKQ